MWKSDNELCFDENPAIYRRGWRYSGHAGLYAQFVSPAIKLLDVNTVVAGRAMPVLGSRTFTKPNRRR